MARRHSSRPSAARCGLLACTLLLALAGHAQAASTDLGGSFAGSGRSTLIEPDGKLLVVGRSGNDFGLARYTADGALDKTFSGDGKLATDFSKHADVARAVVVQTDGKILVTGHSEGDFALARYNDNGTLDQSFSGDGKVTTAFVGGSSDGQSCVIQNDGKIIVVGRSRKDFALARYNTDGTLDHSFSGDGKQTTDFAHGADSARAAAVRPDGKILVAGRSGKALALARYTTAGKLDLSFSHDGKQTSFLGGTDDGSSI
jgi:serralysin